MGACELFPIPFPTLISMLQQYYALTWVCRERCAHSVYIMKLKIEVLVVENEGVTVAVPLLDLW